MDAGRRGSRRPRSGRRGSPGPAAPPAGAVGRAHHSTGFVLIRKPIVADQAGHRVRHVALAARPLAPDLVVRGGPDADQPAQVRALDEERDAEVEGVDRQGDEQPGLLDARRQPRAAIERDPGDRQAEPDHERPAAPAAGSRQRTSRLPDSTVARRGPQGERQQERRQDQGDRQDDVDAPSRIGQRPASAPIVVGRRPAPGRRSLAGVARAPSRATHSPSAARSTTAGRRASNAAATSASRSTKIPEASSAAARAGARPRSAVGERRSAATRSGWRGRRRTAGRRLGQAALADVDRPASRLRPALAVLASTAIGSVSRPTSSVARRASRRRSARIPEPQPTSSTPRRFARRATTSSSDRARARRGTAASSDGARSRRPSPGRGRGRRRPGRRRWRRQVGRMTSRRPMRRTGKWAFQASAQSASWTTRRLELADRPQPERLEVAERARAASRPPPGPPLRIARPGR